MYEKIKIHKELHKLCWKRGELEISIPPGLPAGNYKLSLLLLLRSCPCPKEPQVLYLPHPQPWLLSFILWMCQLSSICPSGSISHPVDCPGCQRVWHHRLPSSVASSCFRPWPKSRGRRKVRSGLLFPQLPPCKATLGWPIPWLKGTVSGKVHCFFLGTCSVPEFW